MLSTTHGVIDSGVKNPSVFSLTRPANKAETTIAMGLIFMQYELSDLWEDDSRVKASNSSKNNMLFTP
ncbi:MAG: hypothetical protein JKY01_04325 [Pseudomonadales bacterium]|nr:hypothetical protein [Pseudomonadales bacterium]